MQPATPDSKTHLDRRLVLDILLQRVGQALVKLPSSAPRVQRVLARLSGLWADLLQHPHCQLRRDVALPDELVERVCERSADPGLCQLCILPLPLAQACGFQMWNVGD